MRVLIIIVLLVVVYFTVSNVSSIKFTINKNNHKKSFKIDIPKENPFVFDSTGIHLK
jgi:hypothetical protein